MLKTSELMAFAESFLIKSPARKRSAFSEQASLIINAKELNLTVKEFQYKNFINSRTYGESKTKKEGFLTKVLNVIKAIFEAIAKAFGNFWNWLRKLFKSKKLTQAEEKITKLEKEIKDLKEQMNLERERGLKSVRKMAKEEKNLKSELASTKENAKNREEKMNEVIVNLQKRIDDKQAYIEKLQKKLDSNKGTKNKNKKPKGSVASKPVVKEDRGDNPRLKEWIKSLDMVGIRCSDASGYIIQLLYDDKETLMKLPEEAFKNIGTYMFNGVKGGNKPYLEMANDAFKKFSEMSESLLGEIQNGDVYLGKDDAKDIWEAFKNIKNKSFIRVSDISQLTLQTIKDPDPEFAKQVNLLVEAANNLHGNVVRLTKESAKILMKLFQTNNIDEGAVKVLQKYL